MQGAFILAETGLLNFKLCTTHWKRIEELKLPILICKQKAMFYIPLTKTFIPAQELLPVLTYPWPLLKSTMEHYLPIK